MLSEWSEECMSAKCMVRRLVNAQCTVRNMMASDVGGRHLLCRLMSSWLDGVKLAEVSTG